MSRVRDLQPGDEVHLPGADITGIFITRDRHAGYPGLELVIWKLSDGRFSYDALLAEQDIGLVSAATPLERQQALVHALGE